MALILRRYSQSFCSRKVFFCEVVRQIFWAFDWQSELISAKRKTKTNLFYKSKALF